MTRRFPVELVRVIDGDTVELDVDLGFRIWSRQRFRLLGIDTPERGQSGWAEATAYTRAWFEAERSVLSAATERDPDSFDRWLAIIWPLSVDRPSLNQMLLDSGHARPWQRRIG